MKNTVRACVCTCIALSFLQPEVCAQSQLSRYEIGVNAGTFIYQGDLTPSPVGSFRTPGYVFGINVARRFTNTLAARLDFSYGGLRGDDAAYSQPPFRKERAFRFSAPVRELTASIVYHPLHMQRRLNPYLFAGVGGSFVKINRDYSRFNAEYFPLEGISEGIAQDAAHPLPRFIPVAPVGVGLRYALSKKISVNGEAAYRFMSTDYLDGFSLAANPELKDHYYKFSVGVTYAIGARSKYDCPVVIK